MLIFVSSEFNFVSGNISDSQGTKKCNLTNIRSKETESGLPIKMLWLIFVQKEIGAEQNYTTFILTGCNDKTIRIQSVQVQKFQRDQWYHSMLFLALSRSLVAIKVVWKVLDLGETWNFIQLWSQAPNLEPGTLFGLDTKMWVWLTLEFDWSVQHMF